LFGGKRLRQHAPLITGDYWLDGAVRKTRLSERLTPSFRELIDKLYIDWKKTIFSEIEADRIYEGVECENNPFKIKGMLESKLAAVTDDLFEVVDESDLKQALIDNFYDNDDKDVLSEMSYQNCRMVDGIYLDEGPNTPGVIEIHLLLEFAREWFEHV
jgi:hypothetical protein